MTIFHQNSRFFEVPALLFSQVETIVDGMNWSRSDYNPSTRNSQHWASEFLQKLQNATAEEVPP